jgi:hypothetical protein
VRDDRAVWTCWKSGQVIWPIGELTMPAGQAEGGAAGPDLASAPWKRMLDVSGLEREYRVSGGTGCVSAAPNLAPPSPDLQNTSSFRPVRVTL